MLGDKQKVIDGPGTIVGANVKLTGTLKDANDITVHGRVDGEVISEKNVQIGETATVKGPVSADVVTVAGAIKGGVVAKNKLEVLPSGKINGSIETKELIIRSGAKFNGKCVMPEGEEEIRTSEEEKIEEKSEEETTSEQAIDFEIE